MNSPNMSYCRYENTAHAMDQIIQMFERDERLNEYEGPAKKRLIDLCERFLDATGRLDEIIDEVFTT